MGTRSWLVVVGLLVAGGVAAIATGQLELDALLSPAPEPVHHTVARGDTLSKLARTHGCTVAELTEWNGLASDRIDVGQVLVVGWSGEAPAATASTSAARPRTSTRTSPRSSAPKAAAAAPAAAGLQLPPEQDCLAGPSVDGDGSDPEFAASAGLSYAQTKGAMDAFLPTVQRCIEGDWPEGTVQLSITVACTGRVAQVGVVDGGGLPDSLTRCIADTVRYAAFPAHDLPDGETFTYPMRFSL